MKVLVLGASGMAGHTISTYMLERGHTVVGFDNRPYSHCEGVVGDVQDKESLQKLIIEGKFDAIINCIGILNQAAENNKALAVALNSYLSHFLAQITANMDTQIVHMSTDCVFSGKRGSYTEADLPDGETFYDRSKALGELRDKKNVTFRNSIVGPDLNPNGIGLLNWFMQQNSEINGYSKVIWTGLTTLELAKIMNLAITKQNVTGLYNMVYEQPISKYNLLCLFNKYLRRKTIKITQNDSVVSDKSLKRTNFDFDYTVPSYETMVSELALWMKKHREFYPHYDMPE